MYACIYDLDGNTSSGGLMYDIDRIFFPTSCFALNASESYIYCMTHYELYPSPDGTYSIE